MKLLRAEEHLSELQADHERFVSERNPYRMLREADPSPATTTGGRRSRKRRLSRNGALSLESAIHALRSALDHAAPELVNINQPSFDYSEYPVFKDSQEWIAKGPRKLPGVDRKMLAQVQWLQPYRRAEHFDPL